MLGLYFVIITADRGTVMVLGTDARLWRGENNPPSVKAGRFAFLAGSLLTALSVVGDVISFNVSEWADVSTGVTSEGWEVMGLDRYADNGPTRFNTQDEYAISPEFKGVVTQVVMRVKSSNASMTRYLTLTPVDPSSSARRQTAAASTSLTNQTFVWAFSEGVRRFRLQNDTGQGNAGWGVSELTVYVARIDPPSGLRDDPLYCDAFLAGWDVVPKAVRYEVEYVSVTRTPPQYETVVSWDFSTLTNTYGSTRDLDQLQVKFPDILGNLSGSNVCMQAYEGGHIQIGKGDNLGLLALPCQASGGGLTGILCAWKYPDGAKTTMPIYSVRNGVTNDLAILEITKDRAEYRFPFPDDFVADCILLSSTTNGLSQKDKNGRVRVERFAVVSGYIPGTATTNECSFAGTRATEMLVKDLAPGEWMWAVRSFDAEGRDSLWSPFRTVILDPMCPPRLRPGFMLQIR